MSEVIETNPRYKTAARLAAVQALYQLDYMPGNPDKIIRETIERVGQNGEGLAPFDKELFANILNGALQRMPDIDPLLEANLDAKWPYARMEKILKCILRAGAGELLQPDTDAPIIINDYVDVAHGFFEGKEPALVNAVLDKLAKHVRS